MKLIIKGSTYKTVLNKVIYDFDVYLDELKLRSFSTLGGHNLLDTQDLADNYAREVSAKLLISIERKNNFK